MKNERKSWDTAIKHLIRNGLLHDILTREQINTIPRSNISRWKQERDDKYSFCEINDIIKQEIDLIRKLNQSSNIKIINQCYFRLVDTFHKVILKIKGVKFLIKEQKELVVNTIESVKDTIPIGNALRIFNISRSTFENYKAIIIHKCEPSYFNWCVRRFSNQLLSTEVRTIKRYMSDVDYKFWSKSSVYLKAIRDSELQCGITTFYKYCRLLGFKNRPRKRKPDDYQPLRTLKPNQVWCADVTIFKTSDKRKHHIHFLIDHYSKMILGYSVENSSSGIAIKSLIQNASEKYKPEKLHFLTDGGTENVNKTVASFIDSSEVSIEHSIAQKDVIFSNSMVEAINKVIKHQFLFHKEITSRKQLTKVLDEVVSTYNTIRPQMNLGGNTPLETFEGTPIHLNQYVNSLDQQKAIRIQENRKNTCSLCH